ncbi:unnamed protein product [Nippostrongylus brasiliensis]|uniref:Ephrin RBD domain-containing protein n=1 Tax=Nippostrongylus brasiliensis TaxID=27835 RepID=A0A0N4XV57_NIPBR|nr:hypothetical protein Q1695_000945 [Nippostrongylus brasiliensis]VDL70244.1 unnamed protein product [Nippostrongylus brasiliensis]
MINPSLLLLFVGVSYAAVMIYQAKEGDRVALDLGPNIVTWGRQRGSNDVEYIRYCEPDEKKAWCNQFVDEKNTPTSPESKASVFQNGTLVINPFRASDVGDYFSPDEMERIHYNSDGTYWSTPRSRISVVME